MRTSKTMICPNVFTALRMRQEISASAMARACELPMMNYRNLEQGLDAVNAAPANNIAKEVCTFMLPYYSRKRNKNP